MMTSKYLSQALLWAPWLLRSYYRQRRWEGKVLSRGLKPRRVRIAERIGEMPFGYVIFGFLCFIFFGIDIMSGVIGCFNVAQQKMDEARSEYKQMSDRMTEESNKQFERKLEVLDMTRRAKEMGAAVAFEEGPRSPRNTLSYGGTTGKQVPTIPGY